MPASGNCSVFCHVTDTHSLTHSLHTHARVRTHAHTHTRAQTHARIEQTHAHTRRNTRTHTYTCTHTRTCAHTHKHTRIHAHTHIGLPVISYFHRHRDMNMCEDHIAKDRTAINRIVTQQYNKAKPLYGLYPCSRLLIGFIE